MKNKHIGSSLESLFEEMGEIKKLKKKNKTKLVCLSCANDPMSPQKDETILRGENITKRGSKTPYCYDCGEDYSVEKMPIDWKPEIK
jgi:hypothetical protein